MQWYYAKDNQQVGPVPEAEFQHLVRAGTVEQDTLVWHEGMDGWTPYRTAATGAPGALRAARPALRVASTVIPADCSRCGESFPGNELHEKSGTLVCRGCLSEAGEADGIAFMRYAGFWIRFLAKFIDGIILNAVVGLISFGAQFLLAPSLENAKESVLIVILAAVLGIQLVIVLLYSVFFVGRFGGTPGKLVLRLRIVRANGSPISYGRAFGRFFGEWISGLIMNIGYLMAAFDSEKRALHDRMCDTRVVFKS